MISRSNYSFRDLVEGNEDYYLRQMWLYDGAEKQCDSFVVRASSFKEACRSLCRHHDWQLIVLSSVIHIAIDWKEWKRAFDCGETQVTREVALECARSGEIAYDGGDGWSIPGFYWIEKASQPKRIDPTIFHPEGGSRN